MGKEAKMAAQYSGTEAAFMHSLSSNRKSALMFGCSPGTDATEASTDLDSIDSSKGGNCRAIDHGPTTRNTLQHKHHKRKVCQNGQVHASASLPEPPFQKQSIDEISIESDRFVSSPVSSPSSSCCGRQRDQRLNSTTNRNVKPELEPCARRCQPSSSSPSEQQNNVDENSSTGADSDVGVAGSVTQTEQNPGKIHNGSGLPRCQKRRHSADCSFRDSAVLHHARTNNETNKIHKSRSCKCHEVYDELINRELILVINDKDCSSESKKDMASKNLSRSHSCKSREKTAHSAKPKSQLPINGDQEEKAGLRSAKPSEKTYPSRAGLSRRHSDGMVVDKSRHPPLLTQQEKHLKFERHGQHRKGFRHDYSLGDLARSSSHMITRYEDDVAFQPVGSLKEHEFAFVKRSDGWTYAMLASRAFAPQTRFSKDFPDRQRKEHLKNEANNASNVSEESMMFIVSKNGKTKTIFQRHWPKYIRLVSEA